MIKITKEYFVSTINSLQQANDLQDNINKLIAKANNRNIDTTYGTGYLISHESNVIKLLELLMNDVDDWISYYIYELNYGRKYIDGMVTDGDKNIDISSPEKLYDFLIRNDNA